MQDKLETFRQTLATHAPESCAKLRPGRSRDEVESQFAKLPFTITPDAVELYTWADGSFRDAIEFMPGAYFYGLDTSVSQFIELEPMRAELDEIFPQKYVDCFRFLGDFSDGGYAFGATDSPARGGIVSLEIHAPWTLAFASLDKLIDTAIACYQRGVYRADGIPDFERYGEIAFELNPNMEAWQLREGM